MDGYGFGMLSDEENAMLQTAVDLWDDPEFKRKLLWIPQSRYESEESDNMVATIWRLWYINIVDESTIVLTSRVLPSLIERTTGFVSAVGMAMIVWAKYHEHLLGLPREYSFEFLNSSYFTQRGTIDNGKTAKALIDGQWLSTRQKYKLACLHCFKDRIHDLYGKMTDEDMEEFYDAKNPENVKQPGLVEFWTYYLIGDVDKLRGEQSYHDFRLERIVESGNISAFEYWLKEGCSREKDELVKAALKTVVKKMNTSKTAEFLDLCRDSGDWMDIQRQSVPSNCDEKFEAPCEYYVDVIVFLLSGMNNDERIRFLREDIRGSENGQIDCNGIMYSKVLYFFLSWPYQDLFMQTVGLMWEFLPEGNFALLLLQIVDKIEPVDDYSKYGDERTYDYRELFRQLWEQSPEFYKRFILSNYPVPYGPDLSEVKTCTGLLKKLFSLSVVPRTHIKMILASATNEEIEDIFSSADWMNVCVHLLTYKWKELDEFVINDLLKNRGADKFKRDFTAASPAQTACVELMAREEWGAVGSFIKLSSSPEEEAELRENIVSSEEWKSACLQLMNKEEWDKLEKFMLPYFQSKGEVNSLKRKFISEEDVQNSCISSFIKTQNWDAAEAFLGWTALDEEEVKELKRKMIRSPEGMMTCCYFFREYNGVEAIDRFIKWHCPPEEEVKELKRYLIFSDEGFSACSELAKNDKLELASEFINYCLSSEDEIKEFKRTLALDSACNVLKFILISEKWNLFDTGNEDDNWELAQKFVTWCFSSEKEINDYKKNEHLKVLGKEIHFEFVRRKQWKEAEMYFDWLGLSPQEISELKKNTLFHHREAQDMFCELLSGEEDDEIFAAYESKQKALELFLWWYLADKEAVTEFINEFENWDFRGYSYNKIQILRESFDVAVTERLKDFSERKS